jgi:glycosyltransferase involved in cell wall biosynthesis
MNADSPHYAAPEVEIVVPVRNEERELVPNVRRLVAHLRDGFPFTARVTIADNGSTDATWALARGLTDAYPGLVRAVRLDRPGRGRALRAAWSASDADVVAYMDVDLSTDLAALLPLVAPLLAGDADVAIGSRLAPGGGCGGAGSGRSSRAGTTCCCGPRWWSGSPMRSAGSRRCVPRPRGRCCRA